MFDTCQRGGHRAVDALTRFGGPVGMVLRMNFEMRIQDQWESLNEKVRLSLGWPEDQIVRLYQGLPHAIFETVLGLAQFTSHKKSMGHVKGTTPLFERPLAWIFKEAYQVQELQLDQDLATLKKDTSFVMMSADHPITGEMYNIKNFVQQLSQQKIYSLIVHHTGPVTQEELAEIKSPWEIHLYAINHQLAVLRAGGRLKSSPLMAPDMPWDANQVLQNISAMKSQLISDLATAQASMKSFLQSPPKGYRAFPLKAHDRVLLCAEGVSGEAVCNYLDKNLANDSQYAKGDVETTNMCRWKTISQYNKWWEARPTDEELSSLVIVSEKFLKRSDARSWLEKACDDSRL